MRILRLDLQAFGPFTNASLPLDAGNYGLHMLYGPNEAGKTSALRALTQLLFGIPHNSGDNFLHAYQNLRIGAMLQGADGDVLECVRRKGKKNTLRAADDVQVIDPAQLGELLHGLDQQTFCQRFGIDYDELVSGGHAIVHGDGDLGQILFAAGAGLADLRPVQDRLLEEAETLFKPRGVNQVINRALSALAEARKQIRQAQLPSAEWVKHDGALSAAQQRKTELDQQLKKKGAHQQRLQRIETALPLIARRQATRESLREVADAPLLSDDFAERRREASSHLNVAKTTLDEAGKAVADLDKQMRQIQLPQSLLDHAGTIRQLHQEAGICRKAAKDRRTLGDRLDQIEVDLRELLRELGREAELDQIDNLRLPRADRLRIQELASEREALIAKRDAAHQHVRSLREDIHQTNESLAQQPADRESEDLQSAVRRARQHGNLDAQLAEARLELQHIQQQADVDLKKLPLWSGSLQALEQLSVPAPESIDRFETDLDAVAAEVRQITDRAEELKADLRELDREIEQTRLEQDVPTEEDLARLRRRRDEGWQLVRDTLANKPAAASTVDSFVGQFAQATHLAEAYQASVAAADDVADRLRREADHVAAKARRMADRDKLSKRIDDLGGQLDKARSAAEKVGRAWHKLWQNLLGAAPLSPREMRTWAAAQGQLVRSAEAIRKQARLVEQFQQRFSTHREQVQQCLVSLGEPHVAEPDSLAALLDHAEQIIARLQTSRAARVKLTSDLEKLNSQLTDAQHESNTADEQLQRWADLWTAVMQQINCSRETTPTEARAVVDTIEEFSAKLKEASSLRKRILDIDRDRKQFEQTVRQLPKAVTPDLPDVPVEQAVALVNDRLNAALTAHTQLQERTKQRESEQSRRKKASADARRLEALLEAMCEEAACASSDDLPRAEERSGRRRKLEEQLQQLEDALVELAAGAPLAEFVEEAAQFELDQLQPEIQQLTGDMEQLKDELDQVLQSIGSEQAELRRMDGGGQAAEAHEQAEALLAQIRSDAEQYTRLRLASAVLRGAIERYREKNQGPVLQRASELFAELTLGSFDGLRADYNEKGEAVLMGVRQSGGQTVGVEGMSDGTCDQLYLALRLASLETYLAEHDPIPFIVDDILIKFDDDRAVAALKALARLSERTQVIFFTHHEHLVHLAQENLDDDVLFTQTLDYRQASRMVEVSQ